MTISVDARDLRSSKSSDYSDNLRPLARRKRESKMKREERAGHPGEFKSRFAPSSKDRHGKMARSLDSRKAPLASMRYTRDEI